MFFLWHPDPIMFHIAGAPVGWYGFLFALGFLLSQRVVFFIYRREGKVVLDIILWYLIIGCVVGARLVHCLFYDPVYYLYHPLEILEVWEGGLASHGAVLGMVAALWLFSVRHPGHRFLWLLDRITIVALMTGTLVRIGNFINSEIIGTPTRLDFGVVFVAEGAIPIMQHHPEITRVSVGRRSAAGTLQPGLVPVTIQLNLSNTALPYADSWVKSKIVPTLFTDPAVRRTFIEPEPGSPSPSFEAAQEGSRLSVPALGVARHPVQLYEAAVAFLLFLALFFLWWREKSAVPPGSLFGWCLILLFIARILLEFVKEDVAPLEAALPLKMGQLLSIPFIIAGIWMISRSRRLAGP